MSAKKEINIRSIFAVRDFLLDIIDRPDLYKKNENLVSALASQGRWAKWHDESRSIISCSLNTQKAIADEVIDGQYKDINQLRINAQKLIHDVQNTNSKNKQSTKSNLVKTVDTLKLQIKKLEQHNMHLISIVYELKQKCQQYSADGNELTKARFKKDMLVINAKINFTANTALIKKVLDNNV